MFHPNYSIKICAQPARLEMSGLTCWYRYRSWHSSHSSQACWWASLPRWERTPWSGSPGTGTECSASWTEKIAKLFETILMSDLMSVSEKPSLWPSLHLVFFLATMVGLPLFWNITIKHNPGLGCLATRPDRITKYFQFLWETKITLAKA